MTDAELILVMTMLHLVALVAGGGLLGLAFRSGEPHGLLPNSEGGEGGQAPREPPHRPTDNPPIGPPLPGAVPTRVRLRQPGRLADVQPRRRRRGPREPQRPVHVRPVGRGVTENMSQEERFTCRRSARPSTVPG
jgi:hypothetical protein